MILEFWGVMKILDFGECIDHGDYQLHSKFKGVYNYSNSSDLISIVSDSIGQGPNNIVVSSLPKIIYNNLLINSSGIELGETEFYPISISKSQKYRNLFITDLKSLSIRIDALKNDFSKINTPNSLAFLLFPDRSSDFQTTFGKAFKEHAIKAVNNFSIESLPDIVHRMKGIGFGLTPSGDDFNCGILYALNYFKEIGSLVDQKLIAKCYENSLGKNLISNTFLKFAYLNKFYENFYHLLKAIKLNDYEKISTYSNKIISTGHTSGSDMLTGFILTIKGVLNDKKFS